MREVIEEAIKLVKQGQPGVLATVVRTRGSTPQKAGAKLLVRPDGTAVGTLGGGCVEGDMWYVASQMFEQEHPTPQFRKYTLNEEMAARDGLVCGGTMYFYIEPLFDQERYLPLMEAIETALTEGPAVAVATLLAAPESTGLEPGARRLIYEDGRTQGSLGSEELNRQATAVGRRVAAYGDHQYLRGEKGEEVFVEGFASPPTLIILGAGHVGKAVSALAASLGFRIIVVDDRTEFATRERFPEAERLVVADYPEGLQQVPVNANSYILVATRGHRHDDLAVEAAVQTPARYIGLLGSKRKSLMIFRHLHEKGVPLERICQIHAPVGLNIGALTPEELAVSIMGEILACRYGAPGGLMRMAPEEIRAVLEKRSS